MSSQVKVRFAPSPTGDMHVGSARSALFNFLYARNQGGAFVLRIEDTDAERSTEESAQGIEEGLKWLGLDWDEGPYFQSERTHFYLEALEKLKESGAVYRCFCTKDRLDVLRKDQEANKLPFVYDRCCAGLSKEEADSRAENEPFVIRFRTPDDGESTLKDIVRGDISVNNAEFGDFVIARADGSPIFLLVNAVDDSLMGITHVIRGDDQLTNAAKQQMIIAALGYETPVYAHIPLIFGKKGEKLSKRHGAVSTLKYKEMGILPEAMFNYLALIGWSLDDETEIFSKEELIKVFSLERINKAPGVFDLEKLLWMNGVYIRKDDSVTFFNRARPYIEEAGYDLSGFDKKWLTEVCGLYQERVKTLQEVPGSLKLFLDDEINYEEKAVNKFLKKEGVTEILSDAAKILQDADSFDKETLEAAFKDYIEQKEIKFGLIAQPLRVALTGSTASPSLFDVLFYLGREKCNARIDNAIKNYCAV